MSAPPQFVVLHHTGWPGHADHYDLMLLLEPCDDGERRVLKTFATPADVFPDPAPEMFLKRIQDHRRAYLDYEGAVSGGRGAVTRVDAGPLRVLRTDATLGDIVVELSGARLRGDFALRHTDDGVYTFARCERC